MACDWEELFEEEFAFVRGLSLSSRVGGSMDNLRNIKRQLIEDFCFPQFEIAETNFNLILILPEGYSEIKKEYLLEVFKYCTCTGVGVKVGTLREDGNIYLDGKVYNTNVKGILV